MPFSIKERGSRFKFEVMVSKEKNHRDFERECHEFKVKLKQVLGDEFRIKVVYLMHDEEQTFTVSGPLKDKEYTKETIERIGEDFFERVKKK